MKNYIVNYRNSFPIRDFALKYIKEAKTYIKVSNFIFQYMSIVTELEKAAFRGVAVFILSNTRDKRQRKNSEEDVQNTNGGIEDVDFSEFDNHMENLKIMRERGIHVRFLNDLHAKFILVDGSRGMLMSANFSSNSMEKNIESAIQLDRAEITHLERIYNILYRNADIVSYGERNGQSYRSEKNEITLNNETITSLGNSRIRCTIAGQKSNLSKCHINDLYNEIISVINKSRMFCYIVTWHFNIVNMKTKKISLDSFVSAVEKAVKRGVKVCVYTNDKGKSDSQPSNKESLKKLKEIGCDIYGNDNNHSKCIVTENEGIIFTANIDSAHGMTKGFEVGCFMTETQRKDAFKFITKIIPNS